MKLASLPMYDFDRPAVERLWRAVAAGLRQRGVGGVPESLSWPDDLAQHWIAPEVLLSQTCGYPLVNALAGRVQLVGTFRYSAEGCVGVCYRSKLVVRIDDPAQRLEDCRGRVAAFNSTDSQSGYNSLLALVAPLAEGGKFFSRTVASGAHRHSIAMVESGEADVAAIDCVTLAGFQRAGWPRVRVIGETAAAPGLPLITSLATTAAELAALRDALRAVFEDDALAETRQALLVDGFEATPLAAYDAIHALRQQALALGCDAL